MNEKLKISNFLGLNIRIWKKVERKNLINPKKY